MQYYEVTKKLNMQLDRGDRRKLASEAHAIQQELPPELFVRCKTYEEANKLLAKMPSQHCGRFNVGTFMTIGLGEAGI